MIGEKVNPNPGDVIHHVTRIVSKLALERAVLEVRDEGGEYRIIVSALTRPGLVRALDRLSVEFELMSTSALNQK